MNDYEARRQAKIQHNAKLLAELDIKPLVQRRPVRQDTPRGPQAKRRKLEHLPPSRASARIAAAPVRPKYSEDEEVGGRGAAQPRNVQVRRDKKVGRKQDEVASLEGDLNIELQVPVKDVEEIRAGWTAWEPSAGEPLRDESRVFRFDDFPHFTPNKSPEELLREGAFGGSYYRPLRSRKLGIEIEDDWRELPDDWISGLDPQRSLANPIYDASVNKFGVSCGQSIEEWEAAGWIAHEYDVRGWFQWYTRFFRGRRCDDDERQVSRWRKCVGETGRWRRMLLKKYMQLGVREVFDDGEDEGAPEVSPVMHQTCHHWAFEVRQEHLDEAWASGAR